MCQLVTIGTQYQHILLDDLTITCSDRISEKSYWWFEYTHKTALPEPRNALHEGVQGALRTPTPQFFKR